MNKTGYQAFETLMSKDFEDAENGAIVNVKMYRLTNIDNGKVEYTVVCSKTTYLPVYNHEVGFQYSFYNYFKAVNCYDGLSESFS